jgi:uncharacterized protein YjiS (DUF1127 family)
MSSLENASASGPAGRSGLRSVHGLLSLPRWLLARYGIWKRRLIVMDMREFDDGRLADIGLSRADLERALNSPLGIDPTLQLLRARRDPLRGTKRF